MTTITRRTLLAGVAASMIAARPTFSASPTTPGEPLRNLIIWGPPAGPSVTIAHAIAGRHLRAVADKVTLKIWRNPDELRAGLTSGTMDVVILPTQTAANLFNRGLGVRLVNVLTNGLLHVVAADPAITTLGALRGHSVALPYRNDTPDLLFLRLLRAHGLEPGTDLELRYMSSPLEAIQLLATGRIDTALLPEPAGSAAILKARLAGRDVMRVIDLQAAWAEATGLPAALPQAGLGVTATFLEAHRPVLDALHDGLAEAVTSVNAEPARAAADAAAALGMPWPVLEASIPHSNLVAVRARDARTILHGMFAALAETAPQMLGGRLPADEFYL